MIASSPSIGSKSNVLQRRLALLCCTRRRHVVSYSYRQRPHAYSAKPQEVFIGTACSRAPTCARRAVRSCAVRVVSFKADGSSVKSASQAYIHKFASPLLRAHLHVYKFQEDMFDQLLRTPDLDKQLRAGNRPLQWATETVEAAVKEAINIAYLAGAHNPAMPSQGPSASAATDANHSSSSAKVILAGRESPMASGEESSDGFENRVALSDGMGAVRGWEPSGAEGGCTSTNDDEQCEVDWELMEELLPEASDDVQGAADNQYTRSPSPALASMLSGGGNTSTTNSVDFVTDELAAKGAVKVEAMTGEAFDVTAAHTFLQRILYKVNRLNHFWYDDLNNYVNERSAWLASIRDIIEEPWQAWEQQQLAAAASLEAAVGGSNDPMDTTGLAAYQNMGLDEIKEALRERYARDVDPPLSAAQQYVATTMGPLGYCHLLAVGSVDGLVEASRQSRVCAGAANQVACAIFRVLMEEYGTGRYNRKHSTFYKLMMEELGLNTKEEHYLNLLPWQWLASANQNFLITERRRHYIRYAGALTFFEINGPSVYKTYLAAGQRCGLSEDASGYWALHIKEDERHGRQMLDEVAIPLVDMYPHDAWELLWGYDQDRFMGGRAGAALVAHVQAADQLAKELTTAEHAHGQLPVSQLQQH